MAIMENHLSRAQLALLANRLQMPLIARGYIDAGAQPEGDTQYALHSLMSDLSPTQALLCATLTLQEIALAHDGLTYLQQFCAGVLQHYGPQILENPENARDPALDLNHIHDDLEHALELAEMCKISLELMRPETLVFLDILIPQIESQIMIVEEVMRLRALQVMSPRAHEFPLNV